MQVMVYLIKTAIGLQMWYSHNCYCYYVFISSCILRHVLQLLVVASVSKIGVICDAKWCIWGAKWRAALLETKLMSMSWVLV